MFQQEAVPGKSHIGECAKVRYFRQGNILFRTDSVQHLIYVSNGELGRCFRYKLIPADSQAVFVNGIKVYGRSEAIRQSLKLRQRETIMTSCIFCKHIHHRDFLTRAADDISFERKFIT